MRGVFEKCQACEKWVRDWKGAQHHSCLQVTYISHHASLITSSVMPWYPSVIASQQMWQISKLPLSSCCGTSSKTHPGVGVQYTLVQPALPEPGVQYTMTPLGVVYILVKPAVTLSQGCSTRALWCGMYTTHTLG